MVDEDLGYAESHCDQSGKAFRGQVESDLKAIQNLEPDLAVYDEKEKYLAEAEAKLDAAETMTIEKPYYQQLIYETARGYFADESTVEETVQDMADKVGLYLKEQG